MILFAFQFGFDLGQVGYINRADPEIGLCYSEIGLEVTF